MLAAGAMPWLPTARADLIRLRPHSLSLSSTLPDTSHGAQRDPSLEHPEVPWLNALICRDPPAREVSLTAACDVSFPLRVGFDEHPLMPHFARSLRRIAPAARCSATGSAYGHRAWL